MGLFDYFTLGPDYRKTVKMQRNTEKYAKKVLSSRKSAYEIQEDAEKMIGDANEILYKAEDKIYNKKNQLEQNISKLREKENIVLAKANGTYIVGNNYAVKLDIDKEFLVNIERGKFYSEYDNEPFTLHGLFTRSYHDAEIEAEKAMGAARINLARARTIDKMVDTLINKISNLDMMMEREMQILEMMEHALQISKPETIKWLQQLINTSIGNADLTISREHEIALQQLKSIGE